jgi:hypothetical protein
MQKLCFLWNTAWVTLYFSYEVTALKPWRIQFEVVLWVSNFRLTQGVRIDCFHKMLLRVNSSFQNETIIFVLQSSCDLGSQCFTSPYRELNITINPPPHIWAHYTSYGPQTMPCGSVSHMEGSKENYIIVQKAIILTLQQISLKIILFLFLSFFVLEVPSSKEEINKLKCVTAS